MTTEICMAVSAFRTEREQIAWLTQRQRQLDRQIHIAILSGDEGLAAALVVLRNTLRRRVSAKRLAALQ